MKKEEDRDRKMVLKKQGDETRERKKDQEKER